MTNSRWLLLSVSVIAILVLSTILVVIPEVPRASAQQDENKGGRNWIAVDYDRMATQFNPQTEINKQNVQLLELKWIFPIPQAANIGGYTFSTQVGSIATSLVVDGIVYLGSNIGRVFALDAGTGKQLWTYTPDLNFTRDIARGVIIGQGRGAAGLGAGHTHGISYAEGKLYIPFPPCDVHILDALTGKKLAQIADMCVNVPGRDQLSFEEQQKRGFNVACSGNYKGQQSYGPTILPKQRVLVVPAGATDETNRGARGFFAGYDMDSQQLLWRFFLTPPHGGDPEWVTKVADKGWIQGVKASTIPRQFLLNDWGDARCVQAGPGWGQYSYDEETGIVYVATAQPAPDRNATARPGPNVYSNSIIALNARTGELVWWHQTYAHDP
ncbi:MAG: PQQ-binding-like beta-propeller repeat protein, partial [Thaumarchaeota archaeon]|nr:PQQ-binding-like beta-propeller repeat protein [Nitrososphaerota archaeon]